MPPPRRGSRLSAGPANGIVAVLEVPSAECADGNQLRPLVLLAVALYFFDRHKTSFLHFCCFGKVPWDGSDYPATRLLVFSQSPNFISGKQSLTRNQSR